MASILSVWVRSNMPIYVQQWWERVASKSKRKTRNSRDDPKEAKESCEANSDLIHYLDKAEKLLDVSNNVDNDTQKD